MGEEDGYSSDVKEGRVPSRRSFVSFSMAPAPFGSSSLIRFARYRFPPGILFPAAFFGKNFREVYFARTCQKTLALFRFL